jgi:hypothetical protein
MIQDRHGMAHAIPLQSGSIALRIKVEGFGNHDLIKFLNLFGNLYYGTVDPTVFTMLFREKKHKFLKNLISIQPQDLPDLEFGLRMIRTAQNCEWKWPAFVNIVDPDSGPEWATGGSRLLASGICKNNPWQTLPVLLFDQVGIKTDQWICNSVEVNTDLVLHELLGIKFNQLQSPELQMSSVLRQVNGQPRLFLHGLLDDQLDGPQHSQDLIDLTLVSQLQKWQEQYGPTPKLKIYTDWPDLIEDSLNIWDIEIVGNMLQFKHQLFNPGHLERLARNEHESGTDVSHIMYVKNPVKIDLSEFLLWADTEHTTFIEQDWNFLIYRQDKCYQSKIINFSKISTK